MAKTLIVGFGRAGRDLHAACLIAMRGAAGNGMPFTNEIGVVEPEPARVRNLPWPHVEVFPTLAAARRRFGPDTVVHVCTPPSTHLGVLRDAARQGYGRLLVEKPLIDRSADLAELRSLVSDHGLRVFVVTNWLTSCLTARLAELLDKHSDGWERMVISQLKPRFDRTLCNPSHETAFEVEIPHQIALALFLAGLDLEVRTAECRAMVVNGTSIPHMGQANITLQDPRGRFIVVRSDLTAPIRERSIEVSFEDGTRVVGYYPATDADSFSQLLTFRGGPEACEREMLPDNSLSTFFTEAYGHFEHDGRPPLSDVAFNAAVVSTIGKAKALCGLRG